MLLRFIELDSGELRFARRDLLGLRGEAIRTQRRQMLMIFHDPTRAAIYVPPPPRYNVTMRSLKVFLPRCVVGTG